MRPTKCPDIPVSRPYCDPFKGFTGGIEKFCLQHEVLVPIPDVVLPEESIRTSPFYQYIFDVFLFLRSSRHYHFIKEKSEEAQQECAKQQRSGNFPKADTAAAHGNNLAVTGKGSEGKKGRHQYPQRD